MITKRKRLNEIEKLIVIEEYNKGLSLEKIAKLLNCSTFPVHSELKKKGIQRRNCSARRLIVNESKFEEINTDSSYWIGFLMADGSVVNYVDSQPKINLSLSEVDKPHVEKFKSFLESEHALTYEPNKNTSSQPMYRFSVRSQKLADDLAKWGVIPKKTFVAKVHEDLCYNKDFWRGVVDGDGSFGWYKAYTDKRGNKKYYPRFGVVGSKDLMTQFVDFVKTIIPVSKTTVTSLKNIYSVKLSGSPAYQIIKVLYDNDHIALDRKKELALKIIKYCEENKQNVDESK